MSDTLVFMMGKFEAEFPTDRRYSKNHCWVRPGESGLRCGFSAYAVRLLQDVYFLEWHADEGTEVSSGQEIGFIESSKAESDLYPALPGQLTRLNSELMNDPSRINVDKYNAGWLYEIEGDESELLSPAAYLEHLASVWEVTQRTIKGQLNE